MFAVFLMNARKKDSLMSRDNLNPTSCKTVLVTLNKRIPATWKVECNKNDLNVVTESKLENQNLDLLRQGLYMEMANNIVLLARNCPLDTLENVAMIKLTLNNPKYQIDAYTKGKNIVKFATMNEKQFILEHLKATVQVKETAK